MSAAVPISPTPAAAMEYVKAGLVLVPFDRGSKGPTHKGWNLREKCIDSAAQASDCYGNIGLAHAYSRTCLLDLDDMNLAFLWFADHNIDLRAHWNASGAVRYRGRPDRGKILYRLPSDVPLLRTRMYKANGFELRCATAAGLTVQDVLPPSIHPDTLKPYCWIGPCDFHNIPEIPAEILTLWQSLCTSPTRGADGKAAPMGAGREDIKTILDYIDPDAKHDEYDPWLRVGFGLHHETSGADVGLQLWDEWSQRGKNYQGHGPLETRWRTFREDHVDPVTIHSIEKMAGVSLSMAAEYEVQPPLPPAANAAPEKPKFKIETPTEFADCEYEDDFIDGVLPDAPYGVIMGQSGSGKTFAAMDLAFAMARGVLWRGRDTKPARGLYVAAEGAVGVKKRMRAYAKHYGIALDSIAVEFLGAAPDLTNGDDVRELIASIKARAAASGRRVAYTHIVIDTWSQVTPSVDENGSKETKCALKNVETIHRATGANILVVAHMGKDITKGMRGWSGFKAAMDYEIEVSRDGDRRTLTVSKSRDGQDGISFTFHLQPVTVGITKGGKPVVSCVVVHDMAPPKHRPVSKVQIAVLATVETFLEGADGGWMAFKDVLQNYQKQRGAKKGDLQPKKDNSRSAVQRALLRLVKKQWLEELDGCYRPFTIAADL
jgi:hypothetical protein